MDDGFSLRERKGSGEDRHQIRDLGSVDRDPVPLIRRAAQGSVFPDEPRPALCEQIGDGFVPLQGILPQTPDGDIPAERPGREGRNAACDQSPSTVWRQGRYDCCPGTCQPFAVRSTCTPNASIACTVIAT